MMATQALQYNNITVSKNEFLRYSYSITVFEKLIAHTQQSFRGVNSWQVSPCFFLKPQAFPPERKM